LPRVPDLATKHPQPHSFVGDNVRSLGDTYTHGHHESVLRSHRWRTAENSAGYLLPFLEPGMRLLDVGCGPGTITLGLAARVAPGRVVGVDRDAGVVADAQRLLDSRPASGVEFRTADAYALEFEDEAFDVVHAHQLLQHLTDPVTALVEMRRVLRPGGVLALRDGDYGGFVWTPSDPMLDRWMELYHDVCRHNGADADAGRRLLGWAQRAGFTEIAPSSSTWTFAEPESRRWWGELWADRVASSSLADQAIEYGLSSRDELNAIAAAWRRWLEQPDGLFVVLHAELVARR
jgi:ubiquinone/menaquinone biosynthesis C-methylase UbiE